MPVSLSDTHHRFLSRPHCVHTERSVCTIDCHHLWRPAHAHPCAYSITAYCSTLYRTGLRQYLGKPIGAAVTILIIFVFKKIANPVLAQGAANYITYLVPNAATDSISTAVINSVGPELVKSLRGPVRSVIDLLSVPYMHLQLLGL